MKGLFFVFVLFVFLSCSSTASMVVNPIDKKTIDSIVQDETIPPEVKTRILSRFQEVNSQAIEVIGSRNVKLQEELYDLKEQIEQDRWKVEIVNTITKFFWIAVFGFLLYIGFKFRRFFGSPI